MVGSARVLIMEAMSIESLVLSAWEEEGYVGKNRVPIGNSDIDALAIHAGKRVVRIGESKIGGGSQHVFSLDEYGVFDLNSGKISELPEAWFSWLKNLGKLWKDDGESEIPWMLDVSSLQRIEIVFCINV